MSDSNSTAALILVIFVIVLLVIEVFKVIFALLTIGILACAIYLLLLQDR